MVLPGRADVDVVVSGVSLPRMVNTIAFSLSLSLSLSVSLSLLSTNLCSVPLVFQLLFNLLSSLSFFFSLSLYGLLIFHLSFSYSFYLSLTVVRLWQSVSFVCTFFRCVRLSQKQERERKGKPNSMFKKKLLLLLLSPGGGLVAW